MKMNMSKAKTATTDLLKVDEVAEMLRVKPATLYVGLRKQLPFIKVGHSLRMRRSDFDAWLLAQRENQAA
jgi:excisionase family DNA binding protein